MSGIERIGRIDRDRLSGAHYFASLTAEGARAGLLSTADLERLRIGSLGLLRDKVRDYTGGASSSVRTELAESLMTSNLYTVSLRLKKYPCPDDAVTALREASLSDLYRQGRAIIGTKLRTAKSFYLATLKNRTITENRAYSDTLEGGFPGFFKLYTPDYAAQEIHISADYPLAVPVTDLTGVEFIQRYLAGWKLENDFCARFTPQTVHRLLLGYHDDYAELILNLFEQLLTAALGCVLCGTDPRELNLPPDRVTQIQSALSGCTRAALTAVVERAWAELQRDLSVTSPSLLKYIDAALPGVAAELGRAAAVGHLERALPPLR